MNGKRCKQCLSLLLMGMLALMLLSGCGTAEKDSGGDPAKLSSFEAEVIRLVNEEREAYGLPALTTTDALTAAAAAAAALPSCRSSASDTRPPAKTSRPGRGPPPRWCGPGCTRRGTGTIS